VDKAKVRLVRIPNSLHLERIWLSEAYRDVAEAVPGMEVLGGPEPMAFDAEGFLQKQ
jgi:hypothetical protein